MTLKKLLLLFPVWASTSLGGEPPDGFWLDPRCEVVKWPDSEVARGADGRLLTVHPEGLRGSLDGGKSWREVSQIAEGDPVQKIEHRYDFLLNTQGGVLVLVYIDPSSAQWIWDAKLKTATTARRDVWSVRSLDGGKTWVDRTLVREGYCGHLSGGSFLELPSGRLAVPIQHWLPNENRHAQLVCFSDDQGKTWRSSSLIDVGGRGHHDGAMESTMARLEDGRLWLLVRTNLDAFWQSFSSDDGETWSKPEASSIDASSSPGALKRLSDGRLILVWNRLYPEGHTAAKRKPRDGNYASSNEASSHREELSVSFSSNDGKNWTKPIVVARMPEGRICYPRIFEKASGEVLVTVVAGPPNRYVTLRFDPAELGGSGPSSSR